MIKSELDKKVEEIRKALPVVLRARADLMILARVLIAKFDEWQEEEKDER